jgi:hypothetical protein
MLVIIFEFYYNGELLCQMAEKEFCIKDYAAGNGVCLTVDSHICL